MLVLALFPFYLLYPLAMLIEVVIKGVWLVGVEFLSYCKLSNKCSILTDKRNSSIIHLTVKN